MGGAEKVPRLFGHHHEGRQAEAALEIVRPLLDTAERELLGALKERFRAGERDAQAALILVAQLVALGDLREELERNVRRGNRAVEKLIAQT